MANKQAEDIAASTDRLALITNLRLVTIPGAVGSDWTFIVVELEDGRNGIGEATLNRGAQFVAAAVELYRDRLIGRPVSDLSNLSVDPPNYPSALPMAVVVSALDQAYWDLLGKDLDSPVWRLLGGTLKALPYYANLNRTLVNGRSPQVFASTAAAAVASGATAVKIAPFDDVMRADVEQPDVRSLIDAGLDRIGSVRDAILPDTGLLIDCHWRFTPRTAEIVLREIEQFNPYWVEAPIAEGDLEGARDLRRKTNLRLAGGEMLRSLTAIRKFLGASGVDVLLPDVKHCGGISGMMRSAAVATAFGAVVSPHNPSGPVASIASAHASMAMPGFSILEWPWGESEMRSTLVGDAEVVAEGELTVGAGAGFGIKIDESYASQPSKQEGQSTVAGVLFGASRPDPNGN